MFVVGFLLLGLLLVCVLTLRFGVALGSLYGGLCGLGVVFIAIGFRWFVMLFGLGCCAVSFCVLTVLRVLVMFVFVAVLVRGGWFGCDLFTGCLLVACCVFIWCSWLACWAWVLVLRL